MYASPSTLNFISRQLLIHNRTALLPFFGSRTLYSPSALGVDGYLKVREQINMQFKEMADRFKTKMKEFSEPDSINMVFTEDLKHMVHLAQNCEEDMKLVEDMMVKFNKQNRDLRFGNYVFGPVIMRMYHYLNKPKEALQAFLNPDLDNFFDQVVTYQILMDLLLKNEMYDEVMQVMDIVKNKQLAGSRFPRTVVVLTMAAAYKKNTDDSLEYMKRLWSELQDAGHEPMRRAVTFAAALAVNQGAAHIALELLSSLPQQNYVTIRNLRVLALAEVNRPDDALPILRSVLEIDGPREIKHTFSTEVMDTISVAVSKSNNKAVQQEFQRIFEQLTQLGHITDTSLDSQLCSEIEKIAFYTRQTQDQRMVMARFENRNHRQREGGDYEDFRSRQRKGLVDME